jgi:succinate dehydrogenase hydrophobic anchor subunit
MTKSIKNDRLTWLWVWVAGAFLVMLTAWAVMITVASKNRVAEVPLATRPVR